MIERWRGFQSALSDNAAERARTESEVVALTADQASNAETIAQFEELHQASRKLETIGLKTRSELADLSLQLISTRNERQNIAQRLNQARLSLERLDAQRRQIVAGFLSEVNAQLTEARQAILLATQELARLREREALYLLRAPVSGTVNEILVHTVGGVVSPSERLLTIVPDDVSMEIEANLENKDIGFVELGQAAEIKLEAFPFTRFGVIDATVTHVSPDAIIDENRGPVFAIRLAPQAEVLTRNGKEIRLSPGMRATAEIRTGDRTVLEFFLAPLLRYRDEAIRER
jgi:hemolysin D